MVVRRIARPMLAAPFVVLGVDALRHPEKRAATAQPVVEKVAEMADRTLPMEVPHEPEQWVQINAGVMVGAGTLYALGKLPRLCALLLTGSLVPTTLAGHRFWEFDEEGPRQQQRIHFFKNLGLVGALLIAAVDTEGKPSVGWRARRAAKRAGELTDRNLAKAQKGAATAQKKALQAQKKAARTAAKGAAKVVS